MNRYRRRAMNSASPLNRSFMEDERFRFFAYEEYKKPNIISRNSMKSQNHRYQKRFYEGAGGVPGYSTGLSLSSSVVDLDNSTTAFQNVSLDNAVVLNTPGVTDQGALITNHNNDQVQCQSQYAVENDNNIVVIIQNDASSSASEYVAENENASSSSSGSYLILQVEDGQNILLPSSFAEGQQLGLDLDALNNTDNEFNTDFSAQNYEHFTFDSSASALVHVPDIPSDGYNCETVTPFEKDKAVELQIEEESDSAVPMPDLDLSKFDCQNVGQGELASTSREEKAPEVDSTKSKSLRKSEPTQVKFESDDRSRKLLAQEPCHSKEIVTKFSLKEPNVKAKPFRFDFPELTESMEMNHHIDLQTVQNETFQSIENGATEVQVINKSVSTRQLGFVGFKCPYCPAISKKSQILIHINRAHKDECHMDGNKVEKQICKHEESSVRRTVHAAERKEKHIKPLDEPVIEMVVQNDSPKIEISQPSTTPMTTKIDKSCSSYKCDGCHKRFDRDKMFNFIKHRLNHIKDKSYTCEICGKVYNHKIGILSHIMTHQDGIPRPYECEICFKSFKLNSHLIAHRRAHVQKMNAQKAATNGDIDGDSAKFFLSVKKSYKYKSEIAGKKNVLSNQGIKQAETIEAFFCPVCDDIFPNQSTLENHQEDCYRKDGGDMLNRGSNSESKSDWSGTSVEPLVDNLVNINETAVTHPYQSSLTSFSSTVDLKTHAKQHKRKIIKEENSSNIKKKLMGIAIDIMDMHKHVKLPKLRGRPKKVIRIEETTESKNKIRVIETRSRKRAALNVLNKSNTIADVNTKAVSKKRRINITSTKTAKLKFVRPAIKARRSARIIQKYK